MIVCILVCKGKILLSILMASVICLDFNIPGEGIIGIPMASVMCLHFGMQVMPSVISVHFTELVDYHVT